MRCWHVILNLPPPTVPRFDLKQSTKLQLTSYADLVLIGQCCRVAQVEAVTDPKLPVSQGLRVSGVVKATVGLLTLGKSDFEAIQIAVQAHTMLEKTSGCAAYPISIGLHSEAMRNLVTRC